MNFIIIWKDLIKKDLQIKMQVLLGSFVVTLLRMTNSATLYKKRLTTSGSYFCLGSSGFCFCTKWRVPVILSRALANAKDLDINDTTLDYQFCLADSQ